MVCTGCTIADVDVILQKVLPIGVVGVSYKSAPLSVRERVARIAEKLDLCSITPYLLLSTCNRTEIYLHGEGVERIGQNMLALFQGEGIASPFFYSLFHIEAFSHLCKVTAGLDSAIIGETEIQHQVKLAYAHAAQRGQLPKCLHYICQKALHIGKEARRRFAPAGPTLHAVLWNIAANHHGPLSRILFVGFSEINCRFAKFLQRSGKFSMTLATSQSDVASLPGITFANRSILQHWQTFDWVVCATRSPDYLIQGTGCGSHLVFDLSVPRNVDPLIQGVSLWNMEQINRRIEEERRLRCSLDGSYLFVKESAHHYAALYAQSVQRARQVVYLS